MKTNSWQFLKQGKFHPLHILCLGHCFGIVPMMPSTPNRRVLVRRIRYELARPSVPAFLPWPLQSVTHAPPAQGESSTLSLYLCETKELILFLNILKYSSSWNVLMRGGTDILPRVNACKMSRIEQKHFVEQYSHKKVHSSHILYSPVFLMLKSLENSPCVVRSRCKDGAALWASRVSKSSRLRALRDPLHLTWSLNGSKRRPKRKGPSDDRVTLRPATCPLST